jgi:TRAP-type C4-dicarboxylate transport system permease small subunit
MVKKIMAGVSTGVSAVALAATTAFAADQTINVDAKAAGFQINDISKLISALLKFTLGIVGLLVFIYLIWGGIEWLTAGGDKSKTESARQKITNAIIGLAIVASAFAISVVLQNFFGISIGSNISLPSAY